MSENKQLTAYQRTIGEWAVDFLQIQASLSYNTKTRQIMIRIYDSSGLRRMNPQNRYILEMLRNRYLARLEGNWQRADYYRDELSKLGYKVEDWNGGILTGTDLSLKEDL